MKVRIISTIGTWYSTRIGQEFNVVRVENNAYYRITDQGPCHHNYLLKDDCVDIKELRQRKLKRICNDLI